MNTVAQHLREVIETTRPRLFSIPEPRASERPYREKWSIKEILGHLIDSAANNHQRIVRMQETANINALTYAQTHWVESQHYQSERWEDVVELWYHYNLHLAHIIASIEPGSLGNICDMGYSEPATLKFVVEDYVRHLEHHIDQIFSDADPRERQQWVQRRPSLSQ